MAMVERSDRMWSTGEGNGKPLQYSCLENPMNSMKRQNDRILKEELPTSSLDWGWSSRPLPPLVKGVPVYGKTIALTKWTFAGKVMSLLFNMLSRLVMAFLPRSKRLLISWLQSSSAMILGHLCCYCYCC